MKVVIPNNVDVSGRKKPLLALTIGKKELEANKCNSKSYSLRIEPASNDSAAYVQCVRALKGSESIRQILQWSNGAAQAIQGLNISACGPAAKAAEPTLQGMRLTSFRAELPGQLQAHFNAQVQAARNALPPPGDAGRAQADRDLAAIIQRGPTIADNSHFDHVVLGIRNVLNGAIPPKALKFIKRYFRRECRKPVDMSAREYFDHLMYINTPEIPQLPTNRVDPMLNMFTEDELTDILLYATPKPWEKEMDRQGFEPLENSLVSVLTMMERIEAAEAPSAKISKIGKPKKAKKAPSHSKPKGGKYCALLLERHLLMGKCATILLWMASRINSVF